MNLKLFSGNKLHNETKKIMYFAYSDPLSGFLKGSHKAKGPKKVYDYVSLYEYHTWVQYQTALHNSKR